MYETFRERFKTEMSKVDDGTNRSNTGDEEFWKLVVEDSKREVKLLIVGTECYGISDIGYNGRKFTVLSNGKKYETNLFHVGTIPLKFRKDLKSNCEISW